MYYKDPTFGMNILIDDKGALDIVDLYRVHQSIYIYIKSTLSQPGYCDGPVDNVDEGSGNIVDELEQLLNKLHDDIVDKLNDDNVMEGGNVRLNYANVGVEDGNVGLNNVNVGVLEGNYELNDANVGVEESNVGLKDGNVGVEEGNAGINDENI